jgi:hypothetical protein
MLQISLIGGGSFASAGWAAQRPKTGSWLDHGAEIRAWEVGDFQRFSEIPKTARKPEVRSRAMLYA